MINALYSSQFIIKQHRMIIKQHEFNPDQQRQRQQQIFHRNQHPRQRKQPHRKLFPMMIFFLFSIVYNHVESINNVHVYLQQALIQPHQIRIIHHRNEPV